MSQFFSIFTDRHMSVSTPTNRGHTQPRDASGRGHTQSRGAASWRRAEPRLLGVVVGRRVPARDDRDADLRWKPAGVTHL
jgi:hypothetical protein